MHPLLFLLSPFLKIFQGQKDVGETENNKEDKIEVAKHPGWP